MEHYAIRRKKLLEESDCDGVILVNIENSSKPSLMYYTGFTGSFATVVITKEREWFITDSRYTEQAKMQTGMEVVQYKPEKKFTEFLADFLKEREIKKLGVEKAKLTLQFAESLFSKLEDVQTESVDEIIMKHRQVKEEWEIDKIKKAVDIAEKAFLEMLNIIKPGKTEREVAAYLEYKIKEFGAEGVSFETIIASGYRSAMPHGIASNKVIKEGDIIVVDFGAIYEGYCSDITRMVSVGTPKDEVLKIHEIVLNAQNEALTNAKPGMKGKDIDDLARSYIEKKGYGERFGHGLGHGIGLEVHEMPRISKSGENEITEGMVFTVEPGIYFEGKFGIRIEEDVVMRKEGLETLTTLDRGIFTV